VPLMLDEPICSEADIDRAAAIKGVGFCKVKLKRFGGIGLLASAIERIQDRGMSAVLGDGLGGEIACWMEACVARDLIKNAGEFNGYLKAVDRVLLNPPGFNSGAITLPANYQPALDNNRLSELTADCMVFRQ